MKYRTLGRTGQRVSIVGLGGAHIGLSQVSDADSVRIVRTAIENGINFMDNSWDYNGGQSEIRMGKGLRDGYRQRVFLMTKLDGHDAKTATAQLDESLRRLQVDHIDLIQFHEVIRMDDPEKIFAPSGALEGMLTARQAGKVRYIGFTGHKSPEIHLHMLDTASRNNFTFDTVQMPPNCFDPGFHSFENEVLPEVNRRGMAALGMKSLGGSGEMVRHGVITAQEGLRYAMSLPVATTISGIDTMEVLDQNLAVAVNFQPFSSAEMQQLRDRNRQFAADGRFELFKITTKYDGKVGRQQHHFPPVEELPL